MLNVHQENVNSVVWQDQTLVDLIIGVVLLIKAHVRMQLRDKLV
jgi:hypothetical protein